MTKDEQLRDAIKAFTGKGGAVTLMAEVTKVNEKEATITVKIGDLTIEDVRLRSIVDGDNGVYIIPETNSMVRLIRIEGSDEFQVIGYSTYTKVLIKGKSVSLEINQDNIIFNANALSSYMADINKLVAKINVLEQDLNSLKTAFTSWVPVVNDGGAALKTITGSWSAQTITQTVVDDIKDEKILN
jgi:hypothetical protein